MPAWAVPLAISAGSALASKFGKPKRDDAAEKLRQMALAEFSRLDQERPSVDSMKVRLQELVSQGAFTPEEAQTILQENSAYEDIQLDPTARNAQLAALQSLMDVSESDGMSATSRAKLADINDEVMTAQRGARGAILQNAAERGVAGSGLELASQLGEQQAAATRASRQATDVHAAAEQAAYEALIAGANLGGQIRGQDYQVASDKAAATDAINRFNAANKQQVLSQNVDRRNMAQAANLAEKQRISDTNVANANANSVRNSELLQRDFENKAKIAAGKTGQLNSMSTENQNLSDRKRAYDGQIIGNAFESFGNWAEGSSGGLDDFMSYFKKKKQPTQYAVAGEGLV